MPNYPVPVRMRRFFNAATRELFRFDKYFNVLNLGCGHNIDREGKTYSDYIQCVSMVNVDSRYTTKYVDFEVPFSGGLEMKNPVDVYAFAEKLPFNDESFDLVFCNWAFHDFEWKKSLEEIKRVLTQDGRFFATYCIPPVMKMSQIRGLLRDNFDNICFMYLVLDENLDGRDGTAELFYGTKKNA